MTKTIGRAERLARALHAGQVRGGEAQEPYAVHLEEVAAMVAGWGGSEDAIAAAWLHDTVEDCPPFLCEDVAAFFGDDIAGLVGELTDDTSLPNAERKRMQVVNAPGKSPGAALVKLADKISNVGALADSPPLEWSSARRLAYVEFAEKVVNALPPGLPEAGLAEFAARAARVRKMLS